MKSFHAEGLQFECTACGKCCSNHSDHDYVYLTKQDVAALSKELGLAPKEFRKKYTRNEDGELALQDRDNSAACIFLNERGQCSVYQSRPLQCRTFPFWPENMNPNTWKNDIAADCPGVGKGPVVPASQIEEYLSWDEKERYPNP